MQARPTVRNMVRSGGYPAQQTNVKHLFRGIWHEARTHQTTNTQANGLTGKNINDENDQGMHPGKPVLARQDSAPDLSHGDMRRSSH